MVIYGINRPRRDALIRMLERMETKCLTNFDVEELWPDDTNLNLVKYSRFRCWRNSVRKYHITAWNNLFKKHPKSFGWRLLRNSGRRIIRFYCHNGIYEPPATTPLYCVPNPDPTDEAIYGIASIFEYLWMRVTRTDTKQVELDDIWDDRVRALFARCRRFLRTDLEIPPFSLDEIPDWCDDPELNDCWPFPPEVCQDQNLRLRYEVDGPRLHYEVDEP